MELRYGTVTGWRSWTVEGYNSGSGSLQPMMRGRFGFFWETSELTADHSTRFPSIDKTQHPAPAVDCTCGIYLAKLDAPADLWYQNSINATGPVYAWGHGFEGDKGYRVKHVKMRGPMIVDTRCFATVPDVETIGDTRTWSRCQEEPIMVGKSRPYSLAVFMGGNREVQKYEAACEEHLAMLQIWPRGIQELITVDEWFDWALPQLEARYEVPFWTWRNLTPLEE